MKIARVTIKKCDICKQETAKIVGKLQFIPAIPGVSSVRHSNYTHHLDVGVCCKDRLFKSFNFRMRVTAAEYQAQRKAG